jgi:hypothetical protein
MISISYSILAIFWCKGFNQSLLSPDIAFTFVHNSLYTTSYNFLCSFSKASNFYFLNALICSYADLNSTTVFSYLPTFRNIRSNRASYLLLNPATSSWDLRSNSVYFCAISSLTFSSILSSLTFCSSTISLCCLSFSTFSIWRTYSECFLCSSTFMSTLSTFVSTWRMIGSMRLICSWRASVLASKWVNVDLLEASIFRRETYFDKVSIEAFVSSIVYWVYVREVESFPL